MVAFVRGIFLENWGLKLLSLAFAVLLWMFVVGENRSEVSLSLPLELTRVPQSMVVVSRVPEAIRVRLNGPRSLLAGIKPNQLVVRLDLEGVQPGISGYEILPSRLNLPRGIEVTYISPSVITLEADVKTRKVVPVKPRLRGTPAEGFEVAGVRAEPAEVEVEGAERAVGQLRELPTDVVDVTGLDGSVARPVELAYPEPSLRAVNKKAVRVEVAVQEMRGEREFIQVPVAIPRPGLRTHPPAVNVKVEGTLRAVSRLTAKDIVAKVEPFGEQLPPGPVRVVASAPAEVRVVAVEPNLAQVARDPLGEQPARPPPAPAPPAPNGRKGEP